MDLETAIEAAIQGKGVDRLALKTDSVLLVRGLCARFGVESDPARREQIVQVARNLLVGNRRIHDREILANLLRGAAVADRGADLAVELLVGRGDPQILASMPDALLGPLEADPQKWLKLTAWAKPPGALGVLKGLVAKIPALKTSSEWSEAMAANGDQALETAYITRFQTTVDPSDKQDFAEAMRRIGTPKTLAALAQEMRTPLVYRLGRVFQTPVREHIGLQLILAFPELEFPPQINSDEGYAQIEAFCKRQFNTTWKTQRPPVEHSGPLEHGYQPIPDP